MQNVESLDDLTPDERSKILNVLKKEAEVRNQEKDMINELNYLIQEIEKTSLSDEEAINNPNLCGRCRQYFSGIRQFFVPFKQCDTCEKRICKNCTVLSSENVPICVYCNLRHRLVCISGSWFFTPEKDMTDLRKVQSSSSLKTHEFLSISFDTPKVFIKPASSEPSGLAVDILSESTDSEYHYFDKAKENVEKLIGVEVIEKVEPIHDILQDGSHITKEEPEIADIESQQQIPLPEQESKIKEETKDSVVVESIVIPQPNADQVHIYPPEGEESTKVTIEPYIPEEPLQDLEGNVIDMKDVSSCPGTPSSAASSTLESLTDVSIYASGDLNIVATKPAPTDHLASNGYLHGMVRIEVVGDRCLIKVKVIEAVDLKPLPPSTIVNSLVVCQAKCLTQVIFKERTSAVKDCSAPVWGEVFEFTYNSTDIKKLMIFLLVKKPHERKSIKTMLKKTEFENTIYGSVRIGCAGYLTSEETSIWSKLDSNMSKGITDWVEFKIHLNKIGSRDTHSSQTLNESSARSSLVEAELVSDISTTVNEEHTNIASIPLQFYGHSNISGSLSIDIKYVAKTGCLRIKLGSAKGLSPPPKPGPGLKVFAICKLVPKFSDNDKKISEKIKDIQNPEFNSTFFFETDPKKLNDTYLITNIYRVERIMSKVFLGQVMVPIGALVDDKRHSIEDGVLMSYPLSKKIPYAPFGFVGTIQVSVRFNPFIHDPRLGQLEVRILKGNNLLGNNKKEPVDSFVSCALLPITDPKNVKHSKVVKKSNDPEWKYSLSFRDVELADLRTRASLEVTVWTQQSKFIGGTRIGNRSDFPGDIWLDSDKRESNLWCEMIEKRKDWVFATLPLRYTMLSQNLFPSLLKTVSKLYDSFSEHGPRLFFDITYSTSNQPAFHIYLQSLEGMYIEQDKIWCKILIYSNGVIEKSHTVYLESINNHEWEQTLQVDIPASVETSAIELRIKTHKTSREVTENNGTVFGRVLLSKAASTNEWSLPSQEEIDFFNNLIQNPNQRFSAQLLLNPFSKPKTIIRKMSRKESIKRSSIVKLNKPNEKVVTSNVDQAEPDHECQLKPMKKVKPKFRRSLVGRTSKTEQDIDKLKTVEENKTHGEISKPAPGELGAIYNEDKLPHEDIQTQIEVFTQPETLIHGLEQPITEKIEVTEPLPIETPLQEEEKSKVSEMLEPIEHATESSGTIFMTAESATESYEKPPEEKYGMEPILSDVKTTVHEEERIKSSEREVQMLKEDVPILEDAELTENPHVTEFSPEKYKTEETAENHDEVLNVIYSKSVKSTSEIQQEALQNKESSFVVESPYVELTQEAQHLEEAADIQTYKEDVQKPTADESGGHVEKHSTEKQFEISTPLHVSDHEGDYEHPPTENTLGDQNIKEREETVNNVKEQQTIATQDEFELKPCHIISETVQDHSVKKPAETLVVENIGPTNLEKSITKRALEQSSAPIEEVEQSKSLTREDLPSSAQPDSVEPIQESENDDTADYSIDHEMDHKVEGIKHTESTKMERKPSMKNKLKSVKSLFKKKSDKITETNDIDFTKNRTAGSSFSSASTGRSRRDSMLYDLDDTISTQSMKFVSGKLQLRLVYSPDTCNLTIVVKKASGINSHDPKKNTKDIYASVRIYPDKSKNAHFKTKVCKNTTEPTWDESFNYTVSESELKFRKIVINLYHKGFAKSSFLGQVIIPMDQTFQSLKKQNVIENWYDLSEEVKLSEISTECTPTRGNLEFSVNLMDYKSESKKKSHDAVLRIRVNKANDVSFNEPGSKAFCKIYFLTDKSHEDKKSTNPVINNVGKLTWDEDILFNISKEKLPNSGIFIKVYNNMT
ncbi:Synaptotagmin-like protein 5 [Thelohanellus kitauei]|uniref:Synaptotagmin-like protein 5 n=1 Tax=Thelohanellus kitauei TaxID=669202 RepID=A0A0C2JKU0_THEKT|nr:Synaptotagmin-like protein 5 [Thelohanellus kitauei]